jgi:hypothetical protein
MVMSQSRVQQSAGIAVTNIAMDIRGENKRSAKEYVNKSNGRMKSSKFMTKDIFYTYDNKV